MDYSNKIRELVRIGTIIKFTKIDDPSTKRGYRRMYPYVESFCCKKLDTTGIKIERGRVRFFGTHEYINFCPYCGKTFWWLP